MRPYSSASYFIQRFRYPFTSMIIACLAGLVLATNLIALCFTDTGAGQFILGFLPNQPLMSVFAGVLEVTIEDAESLAFCTDLNNGISVGCYNNTQLGAPNPYVACLMQYYPPQGTDASDTAQNFEMAARQSAIWHFSDNFTVAFNATLQNRVNAIVQDVVNKYESGECATALAPSLTIDPISAVNFLAPDEDGYALSPHELKITLTDNGKPLPNQRIEIQTSSGVFLASNSDTIHVQTDAEGGATVVLAHDAPSDATITARTTVTLRSGTQLNPGPNIQKLTVALTEDVVLEALATKRWALPNQFAVLKFHDVNRNGRQDVGEALVNWTVTVRELPNGPTQTSALGADGIQLFNAKPNTFYEVCEVINSGWAITTGSACASDVKAGDTVSFGNVALTSVLVRKFHDLNGDGAWGDDEPPLSGWGFSAYRQEGGIWELSYSGSTDEEGLWGFSGAGAYLYEIREIMQTGWYASTRDTQQLETEGQKTYTVDFGNVQPAALTVQKTWLVNGAPQQAPDESAIFCIRRQGPGNPATALMPSTKNGAPITPNEAGEYCQAVVDETQWINLWPGDYSVREVAPSGWLGSETLSVKVTSGQNQVIAVQNERQQTDTQGTIIVTKAIEGDATGTFTICVDDVCREFEGDGAQHVFAVSEGEHRIYEQDAGPEWQEAADRLVYVSAGQTVYVTMTNIPLERDNQTCAPNPDRDLRNHLTFIYRPAQYPVVRGQIHNTSDLCSYDVGMASYKMFSWDTNTQQLIEAKTDIVGPGETISFEVQVCPCATQVDLFYGLPIQQFNPSLRYGPRLLDAVIVNWDNMCVPEGQNPPPPPPKDDEPPVNETEEPPADETQEPPTEETEEPPTEETPEPPNGAFDTEATQEPNAQ